MMISARGLPLATTCADAGQRFVEIVRREVRNGIVETCGVRVRAA